MINKELQSLIDQANKAVDTMLSTNANSSDAKKVKKAKLLAYWLNDYMRLLKKEETFIPTKLKKYKRGDIIQVHLGFNIGSEEGGLHYAVVISTYNSNSSDTLTIIPLSSKKVTYKPSPYTLDIGNTIYEQLNTKYQNLMNSINLDIAKYSSQKDDVQNLYLNKIKDINSLSELSNSEEMKELTELSSHLEYLNNVIYKSFQDLHTINKIQHEVSHLKQGSIALVSQITTISKIRIYNPLNKQDTLSNIKLSPDLLDNIDKKVVELYTHSI